MTRMFKEYGESRCHLSLERNARCWSSVRFRCSTASTRSRLCDANVFWIALATAAHGLLKDSWGTTEVSVVSLESFIDWAA